MNKQNNLIEIDNEQGVDILKWLQLILSNWLFILICIIISLVVAFYVNKLSTPLYTIQSTILINDYHNPLDKIVIPAVSGYQQAFQIENEIGILKSSNLINSTINKLNFWVDYKSKTNNFTYVSIPDCPFTVEFDLFHPQLVSSAFKLSYVNDSTFKVEVETDETFTYDYFYHKNLKRITGYNNEHIITVGNSIETPNYKFTVIFNDSIDVKKLIENRYAFEFHSLKRIKGKYSQFEVENIRGSSILKLTLKSANPKKAAVFLNKLTEEYLNKGIEREDKIASKTIEFIDNQLVSIVDSLTVSENQLEDFRKQNQLLNLDFQAQQAFQKMEELQNEKSRFIVKLRYIDYLTESLSNDEHTDNLIVPASLEINDPVLNNLVNDLVRLFKEHSELSLNSLKNNPYLSSLEQQINYTKEKLSETIKNISDATQLALDNNQKRIDLIEKRINKLPQDQRMLFNIERRFQLNDELYTFLLTKRSEMQIIKASNLPKNEIL
ncbi:MAG: hypothetical protein MI922_22450, partial [Bacteroidales bacterium]|nr:hypothetical protein [Bacteroidales bacterium]